MVARRGNNYNKNNYKLRKYNSTCRTTLIDNPIPLLKQLSNSNHSIRSTCRILNIKYKTLTNYLTYIDLDYKEL